jgi:hypothetical protein
MLQVYTAVAEHGQVQGNNLSRMSNETLAHCQSSIKAFSILRSDRLMIQTNAREKQEMRPSNIARPDVFSISFVTEMR